MPQPAKDAGNRMDLGSPNVGVIDGLDAIVKPPRHHTLRKTPGDLVSRSV
jgi:hypothetical protein